jgi:hypothetical protein
MDEIPGFRASNRDQRFFLKRKWMQQKNLGEKAATVVIHVPA